MSVTGQIERDERSLQREGHRVEGVRVLRSAVNQHELGGRFTPAQATDLAQTVDRDEEPLHSRDLYIEVPLVKVLAKERKLVIRIVTHAQKRMPFAARDREVKRPTCVVVLAAGEGTRMRSSRPKPLHQLCGRAMVRYVLDAVAHEDVRATIVVVGHHGTWVEKELSEGASARRPLTFVEQREQLGTGHAVSVALGAIVEAIGDTDGDVLIVPGDAPLLKASSVARLLEVHRDRQSALTVLSARLDDPTGYGRVIHAKDGTLERIVEERDARESERAINEVNTSIMVVRQSLLGPALRRIGRHNAQQEYYLTDLVQELHDMGHVVASWQLDDANEALGINDRRQLAQAERVLRARINERWMSRGVTMWDPSQTYVDADVELAPEVTLLPGTILTGHCVIARGATIGPNAYLSDTEVGEGATLATVEATHARVGADANVGSFVVLAPGAEVSTGEIVAPFSHRSH